jgi:hypothetical protein
MSEPILELRPKLVVSGIVDLSQQLANTSERRLCRASRSRGPKDDFSTDQTFNDLRSGKYGSHRFKGLLLKVRLSNTSKGGKNENVTSSLVLVRAHFCPVRMAGLVGPQMEMVRPVLASISDPALRAALQEAHAERLGIWVAVWPVSLLVLSQILEKKMQG